MQVVEQLNAKKTRDVIEFLEAQYGFSDELPYVFFLQTKLTDHIQRHLLMHVRVSDLCANLKNYFLLE